MKPRTLLRLALAGTRTDTMRVVLTAISAALATLIGLAAATVLAIPTQPVVDGFNLSEQYRSALLAEPGLRPGVAFGLLLLTIPVLALAGQCARLGAPARDRRLAALRLAGATPRQAITVAAAETGAASALGVAVGFAVYLVGRQVAHRPDANGKLLLPTDVLPPPPVLAAIGLGLPLVATAVAALLLRRVSVTPFGVVRRVRRTRAPLPWPGALILLGLAAFAAIEPLTRWYVDRNVAPPPWLLPVLLLGGGMLAATGAVLGTGWISYVTGRVMLRLARRPAALIAARRLVADPWSGSRVFAALLVCVVFGAGTAGVRAWFASDFAVQDDANRREAGTTGQVYSSAEDRSFYFNGIDLVNLAVLVAMIIASVGLLVALAEGIVARRRAYAALVATGVPRGTLARAVAWQALAPVVPAILVALAVGAALPRGITTESRIERSWASFCDAGPEVCSDPVTGPAHTRMVEVPELVRTIPIPFGDLALVGAVGLAAVAGVVGIGLLFLRSSTAIEELRVG
ncbi:MAG TPA: FtsX-like permease family protein [Pilimelia sp.]|nr:FtsX-like permease family protein [Pilimelia sp.]